MFVAGLVIVRIHNKWARDWTVLVTLSGWFFLGLGLFRMFAASYYQRAAQSAGTATLMVAEILLLLLGLYITIKGYGRSEH